MNRATLAVSFAVLAVMVSTSTASAAWGCGDSKGRVRVFGELNEFDASVSVMRACRETKAAGFECGSISCRQGVDALEQALAIWPRAPGGRYITRPGSTHY